MRKTERKRFAEKTRHRRKKATLTIAYRTAEDYQKFNDMELYTGSVAEALAAGYSLTDRLHP